MASTRRFDAISLLVILALAAAASAVIGFASVRPLHLVGVEPADGARDVPITDQVLVTFTRPVDERSVRAAFSIDPAAPGSVSAAGRRAAFTPDSGFRAGTEYAVTFGAGLRDRLGRPLARPVTVRFRTRDQSLVAQTEDGRLVRATLGPPGSPIAPEPLAGPGVGAFAVGTGGELAYVLVAEDLLVVRPAVAGPDRRIPLPRSIAPPFGGEPSGPALALRDLAWAPGGATMGFVAARRDGVVLPHLVYLAENPPLFEPFGLGFQLLSVNSAGAAAAAKKSLIETLYRRETFAFAPDGKGIIARDRKWDYALLGFDGSSRAVLGPFLAVGNVSAGGDFIAFVDVDPADKLLRRRVVAYERTGTVRPLSPPDLDSHSPRFASRADRVAYAAAEPDGPPDRRRFGIDVVDLASGAHLELTEPPPGATDSEPRWSPDDAWITFRRGPVGDPERARVFLVPADGGAARPLPVAAVDVRWVP